jgi:peptidyl-prolyl cis-trans isomerase SurA
MRQIILLALTLLISVQVIQAQTDPVLFKVENDEVRVSEFRFIYDKNIGSKADYTEASLNEYLEMYQNFKLKVRKAKDMGLMEDKNLQRELDGYRKQLSSSYLTDKEIVDKLVREAYDRSKKDILISHILVLLPENASQDQVELAFSKIKALRAQVSPANFADVATQQSQDPTARENGGDMGYFTSMQLPYELENVIYTTPEGSISEPVRTRFGYHIVWVRGSRPARGQVQAAHILLRTSETDAEQNKLQETQINNIYAELKRGAKFEDLVAKFSEDNTSKASEGVIGWFGINRYSKEFEDAAFALKNDGDFSAPIKTAAGWHIIRRVKAMQNPSYEEARTELTTKVRKDSRFNLVQQALVDKIVADAGLNLNQAVRKTILDSLMVSPDFNTYRWKMPTMPNAQEVLFSVGTQKVTVKEFIEFALRNPADRVNAVAKTGESKQEAGLEAIFKKKIAETALAYEESQLGTKYPDFRNLMREYEEGILLFEVAKRLIWDKASSDETGLQAFYNQNGGKYKWDERARIIQYKIKSEDAKLVAKIMKYAKKKGPEAVVAKFNTAENKLVEFSEQYIEKGKDKGMQNLKWAKGSMDVPVVATPGTTSFRKVESILPSTPKSLQEARGYVVADYQDYLEKEWVKELRGSYKIEVNKDVLKSLVKK